MSFRGRGRQERGGEGDPVVDSGLKKSEQKVIDDYIYLVGKISNLRMLINLRQSDVQAQRRRGQTELAMRTERKIQRDIEKLQQLEKRFKKLKPKFDAIIKANKD